MNLIFKIKNIHSDPRGTKQKGKAPVEVVLEKNNKIIGKKTVESADKVLEGLDKILKKSKIGITAIKSIKVDDLNKNRYTSYRIVKSVEKALKIKLF